MDSSNATDLASVSRHENQLGHKGARCATFYKGKINDDVCTKEHSYICQIGPDTCAPQYEDACDDGWKYWKGGCYFIERKKSTWSEASNKCKEKHSLAKLVEINCEEEQKFLTELFHSNKKLRSYWIGIGGDGFGGGEAMKWTSGHQVVFGNSWCEGEPSGRDDVARGVYLHARQGYCWDDTKSENKLGYICELPANVPYI